MSTVAIDRLLAVLVVALAGSGLLSLRFGAPSGAWLFALHGLLGGALAVTVLLKLRRSVPRAIAARRWGRLAVSLAVGLVAAAALVGGFAWVASGRILTIGSWTVLTLHAWAGLVLVPLVIVHVLPRRWRLLAPRRARTDGRHRKPAGARPTTPATEMPTRLGARVSRRSLLVGAGLALASTALLGAAEAADRLQGGVRRFTGSRWLPPGGVPPPTTFFGEPTPPIDPATWRIRVHGRVVHELDLSPADLAALPSVERAAVLDCTSGWALETTWRGVPMAALLELAGTTEPPTQVVIRSVTGWGTAIDAAESERALLATHVADRALPDGNGAPCRLVVPDRRGLDWVKWVAEIEVT